MISTDGLFIVPFLMWLKDNPLTVALVLFVFSAIAKATPWVGDDKIITFIKGVCFSFADGYVGPENMTTVCDNGASIMVDMVRVTHYQMSPLINSDDMKSSNRGI